MAHVEQCRVADAPLHWQHLPGAVYRSACGRYEITVHHGRNGARYLCHWINAQVSNRPGLFALRRLLDDAFRDATHHASTGEVRP